MTREVEAALLRLYYEALLCQKLLTHYINFLFAANSCIESFIIYISCLRFCFIDLIIIGQKD